MPFIGSLGGAYGYGRGQIATEKSVNAVYVTNVSYSQTILDASGNSWIVGGISSGSTASIYNIKGQLVQTVTNNDSTAAVGNIIGYASADGVSSVWITLIVGDFSGTTVGSTRLAIDSQNNLLLSLCLKPYAASLNQLFKVFNKNTTVNYTLDPCPAYHTFVLIKFNPNGNNSWVATSTNSAGGAYSSMTLFDMKIDSTDAIITYFQVATGTINQNIQFRTSSNVVFGTNISIGASSSCSIIVKYTPFGTSTSSWCGYILGLTAQGIIIPTYPNTIGHECLQINSQNQIICTGRYISGTAVYGANGAQIGPNLLNNFSMNYTYIIRFDVNGSTSTSWRVVLGTSARQDTVPAALLVDNSDNIYCVGFCGARTNAYTFYAYNTSNAQVANMDFTASAMANIYIVKYSNAGAPLWVSSIRGTGTTSTGTVFNNTTFADVNQYPEVTFSSLDVSGNIYIITTYRTNSVSLYVGSTQIGSTLTTSVSGTSGGDLLIARILSNNTSGNITKICSTNTSTGAIFPRPFLILNNDIYIAFRTLKSNLGFYSNGSNTSPLTTLSNTPVKNVCLVCKYDNIFSSVNIAYITSTTTITTDLTMGLNLINFDLSGNIIMTGTHTNTASTSLLLEVYNFGSSTPDITRNVSTAVLAYSYIIKFTLDSTPPWIVRTASASGLILYTTRIIENLLDITKNNKTYTCGKMTNFLYIYDKNNNLITNITSAGNGCFTLSLLNS